MDDDKTIDSFDDLFEPFQLDETPTESDLTAPAQYERPTVACPSCGTRNAADNRHCESCGARIAQGPLPVAPPPMLRTTPGARALGVLAAVILVVALAALLFDFFRGSDSTDTTEPTVAQSVTTVATLPPVEVAQLFPFTVEASSELPGWEAANLIDADSTNSWNDASQRGDGATLTFRFEQPMQISQIVVHNLTDEERFHRNYRIKGLEISINDLPTKALEVLDDTMEPQAIQIASVETTEVTLRVTSTYEAETFNGETPFTELALQEVKFYGRASPTAATGDAGTG